MSEGAMMFFFEDGLSRISFHSKKRNHEGKQNFIGSFLALEIKEKLRRNRVEKTMP